VRDLFGQYVTPGLAEAAVERRGELDGQLVTRTVRAAASVAGFGRVGEVSVRGKTRPVDVFAVSDAVSGVRMPADSR
jgi:hypothetical protein